jgi:hypothetical protein
MATATAERKPASRTPRKKADAAAAAPAAPAKAPTPAKATKPVVPGAPTKKPADLAKAIKQPSKDKKPTKGQVKRAREDWGIEPYFTGAFVGIKSASRGWIVHVGKDTKVKTTLCGIETSLWVGGVAEHPAEEVNCLWCMARVKAF